MLVKYTDIYKYCNAFAPKIPNRMLVYPPYLAEFSKRQNGMTNELDLAMISVERAKLQQNHQRAAEAHALDVRRQYNQLKYKGVEDDSRNRAMARIMGIDFSTAHNVPTYDSPSYEMKEDAAFMKKKLHSDAVKASNEMRHNFQCLATEHWKNEKESDAMRVREIKAIIAATRAREQTLQQNKSTLSTARYDDEQQSILKFTHEMMVEEESRVKRCTQVFEEQEAKHATAFHNAERLHQKTYKSEDEILDNFHDKKNTAFREIFDAHHKAVPAAKGAGKGKNHKGCKDGKCAKPVVP